MVSNLVVGPAGTVVLVLAVGTESAVVESGNSQRESHKRRFPIPVDVHMSTVDDDALADKSPKEPAAVVVEMVFPLMAYDCAGQESLCGTEAAFDLRHDKGDALVCNVLL